MAYIGKTPIVGNFQKCDAITTSATDTFNLLVNTVAVSPESANHCIVSLNGVIQEPGISAGFTISGSTIVFNSALTTSDTIDFILLLGNVLDIGTPSDDTCGAAQIKDDLISGTTALASEPDDTDEFLVSDAGTLKRLDYSLIKGGGKVLQVVQGTHATAVSTTSTSYVTTNLDVAITCAATSSEVLVICMFHGQQSGSDWPARFTIYRAADLDSTGAGFAITRANVANIFTSIAMTTLDSPSSTSELTYTAYMKNGGSGTSTSCTGNSPGRIIAIEIGA